MKRTLFLLFCLSLNVWAADGRTTWSGYINTKKAHRIHNAILIEITPKGKKHFASQINNIMNSFGVDLSAGGYYPLSKEIRFSELGTPEFRKLVQDVDLFTNRFFNFNLKPESIAIKIGPSEHFAQIKKINIQFNEEDLLLLGESRHTLKLSVELIVSDLKWQAETILLADTKQNSLLNGPLTESLSGLFLLNRPQVQTFPGEKVIIRIPLKVTSLNGRGLKFEIDRIAHNIGQIGIEAKWKNTKARPVLIGLPVRENNKEIIKYFSLNNSQTEKEFQVQIPSIVKAIRQQAIQYLEKDLPNLLNRKYEDYLRNMTETISDRSPPGRAFGEGDSKDKQKWCLSNAQEHQQTACQWADYNDLKIIEASQRNGDPNNYCNGFICPGFKEGIGLAESPRFERSITMTLSAFIEDPLYQSPSLSLPLGGVSTINSSLNVIPKDQFDVALAINRGFFNRLLQLSWHRGYLKNATAGDLKLILLEPPQVLPADIKNQSPLETFIKVKMKIAHQLFESKASREEAQDQGHASIKDWFKTIAFKDRTLALSFDVLCRLKSTPQGIEIFPQKIDEKSAYFDDESELSWIGKRFKYRIISEVQNELIIKSKGFSGQKLPFPLPLPPEIWGVRFSPIYLDMDENGFLVLYLNYNNNGSIQPSEKGGP